MYSLGLNVASSVLLMQPLFNAFRGLYEKCKVLDFIRVHVYIE